MDALVRHTSRNTVLLPICSGHIDVTSTAVCQTDAGWLAPFGRCCRQQHGWLAQSCAYNRHPRGITACTLMSSHNIPTRTRCADAKTHGRFSAPVNDEMEKPTMTKKPTKTK